MDERDDDDDDKEEAYVLVIPMREENREKKDIKGHKEKVMRRRQKIEEWVRGKSRETQGESRCVCVCLSLYVCVRACEEEGAELGIQMNPQQMILVKSPLGGILPLFSLSFEFFPFRA